jgi:hypothetical protein
MFPLQENEHVTMYVRRHWIWLALEAFKAALLFLAPVLMAWFLSGQVISTYTIFNYPVGDLLSLFIYVWAIFCWIYFADRFTKYALNFWVLTNKRLVESEHAMLFSRKLSTLPLETIEDATVKFEGVLENIIGFGSLSVQTAGTQREFIADDVADPEAVKQAIFDARENLKHEDREVTVMNVDDVLNETELRSQLDNIYAKQESATSSQTINIPKYSENRESPELSISEPVEVNNNNFSFPKDQESFNYDWANVDKSQKADLRNIQEDVEINEALKKNTDNALRY